MCILHVSHSRPLHWPVGSCTEYRSHLSANETNKAIRNVVYGYRNSGAKVDGGPFHVRCFAARDQSIHHVVDIDPIELLISTRECWGLSAQKRENYVRDDLSFVLCGPIRLERSYQHNG